MLSIPGKRRRSNFAFIATYPVAMKAKFERRRFPGIESINLSAYLGEKFGRY